MDPSILLLTIFFVCTLPCFHLKVVRFMANQPPFLFETLTRVDKQHLPFPTTLKGGLQFFTTPTCACLPPLKQFMMQQMVQFQDSIWKCLHHYTLSNMLSDMIYGTHCVWILSCSGPRVGVKRFTTWPTFPTFWLSSLFFFTTFWTWFGLSHPSIVNTLQSVCTHPIDVTCVHFLHCAHGNEHISTHDVICDNFTTIA